MNSALEEKTQPVRSEEDRAIILAQMERVLKTEHFKNSRRYPALLRFIVTESLAGRGEFLKERLLGLHVFGRPAEYDTAVDPIVRVAAAEVRKRLAQYYVEDAHKRETRIELVPGSYEPFFHIGRETESEATSRLSSSQTSLLDIPEPATVILAPTEGTTPNAKQIRSWWKWLIGAALVLATGMAVLFSVRKAGHPSAIEEFWNPMLAAHKTILICLPVGSSDTGMTGLADAEGYGASESSSKLAVLPDLTFWDYEHRSENVVFSDVLAMHHISNYLSIRKQFTRLRFNRSLSFGDLLNGPAVLIGGLDNHWTLRALEPLRYRFAGSEHESFWISDKDNPALQNWKLDLTKPYREIHYDYAIVARLHDRGTNQVEMVVAGLGMSGTASAGQFVSDPVALEALRKRVGDGFATHDLEVVLGTSVVDGIAGSPEVLAFSLQ